MRTCLLAALSLLLPGACLAGSIQVPVEYATIQEAIGAAVAGDRVVVAPGLYEESIVMVDGVDVIGSDGPEVTTIDCGQAGRAVDALTVSALLQGFTIMGGNSPTNGGGIRIGNGSDLRIDDCIIGSNQAAGLGGGIAIQDSRARITYSTCIANTAAGGAGIYIEGTAPEEITFENCRICSNTASGAGGGVLIDNGACTIIESAIYDNTAVHLGGGIALDAGVIDLSLTAVYANTAEEGGGIAFHNASTGTVLQVTLYANGATLGGAVSCTNNSFPAVTRSILAGSPVGAAMSCRQGSAPWVTCCLLWGNAGGDSPCGGDGANNLQADPEFCLLEPEIEGDFRIQSDSPAAPAGSACLEAIGCGWVSCGTAPAAAATWGSIKLTYR